MKRYWLKRGSLDWQEVDIKVFSNAEKEAGFKPGPRDVGLVTNGFCANSSTDGQRLKGRITQGKINKERCGFDQEFLRVALKK